MRPKVIAIGAVLLVVAVVGVAVVWNLTKDQLSTVKITAQFDNAAGLYEDNTVAVLGMPVGKVTKITPRGGYVEVEFTVDNDVKVPADAQAVTISNSILTDRQIELTPPYRGGPTLNNGDTIGLNRTKTPVEFARVLDVLDKLSTSLRGDGQGNGPVADLVNASAAIADGNGQKMKDSLGELSEALRLSADGGAVTRGQLTTIVRNVSSLLDAAAANDRKVALVGRSMRKNVNIGRSLGHIDVPEGMLVAPREVDQFPDSRMVIISTGSQGEPLSALRRMAYRDHPQVELKRGDTVVFSATPIPGNERAVNETIDRLYHIGCDVVTARDAPIHASGHGYQEELKMMLNLTRPRYVMPVHGDFKRMLLHGELAEAVGVPSENIFRVENGTPLEIDADGARLGEPETAGMIFVDGVDIGDVADVALRDRRMLSADGIFIIVATVSEQDGSSVVAPEVLARGVPFLDDNAEIIDELRDAVEDSLDRAAEQRVTEIDVLESMLHDDVAAFLYNRIKRRPMVLPVVVEV